MTFRHIYGRWHTPSPASRPGRCSVLLCCAALLICLILAVPAAAKPAPQSGGDSPWASLFPSFQEVTQKSFDKKLIRTEKGAPLPKGLRFSIALPSPKWKHFTGVAIQGGRFLAGWVSPQGLDQGLIEVMSFRPKREANPGDWLGLVLEAKGFTPLAFRREQAVGGAMFQALGSLAAKGGASASTMIRAGVMRSGAEFFLVTCTAKAPFFEDLAWDFATSQLMFRPLESQPQRLIGQWARRCLGSAYCFQAPQAWSGGKTQSPGAASAYLFQLEEANAIKASLKVELLKPATGGKALSPSQALAFLADSTARRFEGAWQARQFQLKHKGLGREAAFFLGQGRGQAEGLELMAMAVPAKPGALVVWLTTASRQRDPLAWLHAKAVYEIACRSLAAAKP